MLAATFSFGELILATLFFVICVLLILVVLLQKGRGGGLGAAFGGAGGSAFGTRTGDVFTWVTIVLVALFLLLAVVSNLAFRTPPGKVAMPVFDTLPPGQIGEVTMVKIDCETGGAVIWYTVDGSIPTADPESKSSHEYKGKSAVKVQPGQTLRAIAFRGKWIDSDMAKATYGVEPDLPPVPEQVSPALSPDEPTGDPEAPPAGDGE
ncbi:MAG: preprotein translocase subunit SecG [Planctomycetota bacterium]|jgi:protein translocase SecG subunit